MMSINPAGSRPTVHIIGVEDQAAVSRSKILK
jgi:hypothetical protein